MKKYFYIALILLFCSISTSYSEEWSDYSSAGNLWDGQKSITNAEFEKAIETLERNKVKKENKQKKKKIKKISGGGTSLHPELEPTADIQEQDPLKIDDNEGQLLNLPVKLCIGEDILDTGFYNIFGQKDENGNVYLLFYQSHYFKGKLKANETNDDFDSDSINFVKLIPYNNDYVKIAFGSLDFNAYVYVRYLNP